MTHITFPKCAGVLSLALAALACRAAESPDLSGKTDASIRDVITRVAHHQFHTLSDGNYATVDSLVAAQGATVPEGIAWNYPWGVTLYGMLREKDATGDKASEKFVLEHNLIAARYYAWLDDLRTALGKNPDVKTFVGKTKIGGLMRLGNLDSCGAMGAQFTEGILRHSKSATPEQQRVAATIAQYIIAKQARLPDGTFWRPTSMGGTIWLDDLYMSCPFLLRWDQFKDNAYHDASPIGNVHGLFPAHYVQPDDGSPRLITDCAHQVINMAKRLQDDDGVFYHGYFENEKQHSPIKWGRANGWTMVATVEILSAMSRDHPDRPKLLQILRRQIDGIKPLQTESGMWRQALDKPETWEETSCTAMFAYSIARAVNRGWIDAKNMAFARKAFVGVCRHVTPEGAVNGTCQGTNIGLDLKYYLDRQRPDDDPHGRGPVMLAGAEILLRKVK
jgi:rhamnogalacturonyl hydrolase YesR